MIYNYFIITFLSILIFFISLISYSTAEIINKFEIDGNERIPNETIIMFSGKNIGDDINENNLNEILKNSYESKFFEDVKVSFTENTLSTAIESPLIENIEIKGPKAKKIIKLLKKFETEGENFLQ